MAQPLIASGKIELTYKGSGITHKIEAYVRGLVFLSGHWYINDRYSDSPTLLWTLAANTLAENVSYLLEAGAALGPALLYQRVGFIFVPVDTFVITSTNHAAGAVYPATQSTMVLRDSALYKVKVIVMDVNAPAPERIITPTGGPAQYDSFISNYLITAPLSTPPYLWQASRGDRFLAASPFLAVTIDLNDKLRRAYSLS